MKCRTCGVDKAQSEFYVRPDSGKYRTDCIACCKERALSHYYKDPQKTIDRSKAWAIENKERKNEQSRAWAAKNVEKRHSITKKHYESHKEEKAAYAKQWLKKKRKTDVSYRIKHSVSSAIIACLHSGKNRKSWKDLVGYDVPALKKHLEKKFVDGMTWDNYGPVWHIDHKTPISAFNITSCEDYDFKRCWDLQNLQPMFKEENLKKHDSLERPFQPSLL